MMKKNLFKALFPFASLSLRDIKHWKAVKVSQSVFYLLMTLIVVVYALFFLVGYEHPYDENPDFNAPLLTSVLITFVLLLLLMAVAVTLFAVYRSLRRMRGHTGVVNGVPALRIALGVGVGTFCIMFLSFALAPTDAVSVNGVQYADGLWLRVAEMFVDTSLLLLVAAVVAVAYGYVRRVRNRRKEARNAH